LQARLQENSLKHMTTRTRLRPPEERVSPLQLAVTTALDDMKAVNVRVLDVRELTDVFDTMVIASGNSDRHVRSIAERVVEKAKAAGFRPLGTEGARDGEWVLVDRKSTRLNSSHRTISYAVFCLNTKNSPAAP